jgi:hypothetical protein
MLAQFTVRASNPENIERRIWHDHKARNRHTPLAV